MAILRRSSSFWATDSSSSTRLSLLLCAISISKSSARFNFLSSFSVTVVLSFPCFRDVPGKRIPAETILFYIILRICIHYDYEISRSYIIDFPGAQAMCAHFYARS